MKENVFRVLLVEDNSGDIELMREAFLQSEYKIDLTVLQDGEEAVEYSNKLKEETFSERSEMIPNLIFLDLNLPKKDGWEVLESFRSEDFLKAIPVIVLTTSDATTDIKKAYSSSANCYIKKPIDFDGFFKVIRGVEKFWFSVARLPFYKT